MAAGNEIIQSVLASPLAMVVTNPRAPDNPIEVANQAFCNLTGYAEGEILGRNCRFLAGEQTESWVSEQLRSAIHQRRPVLVDILNYRRDGTPFRNGVMNTPPPPIAVVESPVIPPPIPPVVQAPPPPPPPPPPRKVQSAQSAKGDLRTLFSADDYPASAQSSGAEGTVRASLTIGPDGRVVACNVTQSSGNGSLDSATCNILRRRAKFTPARDQNGQPVTDTITTPPIRWQLEG